MHQQSYSVGTHTGHWQTLFFVIVQLSTSKAAGCISICLCTVNQFLTYWTLYVLYSIRRKNQIYLEIYRILFLACTIFTSKWMSMFLQSWSKHTRANSVLFKDFVHFFHVTSAAKCSKSSNVIFCTSYKYHNILLLWMWPKVHFQGPCPSP